MDFQLNGEKRRGRKRGPPSIRAENFFGDYMNLVENPSAEIT